MADNQNNNTEPEVWGFEALVNRIKNFVQTSEAGTLRTYFIVGLIISVVLMVAASLPYGEGFTWVSPLTGVPAGIILFALTLGLIYGTSLGDSRIFQWKENTPPKKRVAPVIVGIAIVFAILIAANSWLPLGVGGAVMVVTALSAYNLIRRTPYEIKLALQGLPDPREYEEILNEETEYAEGYEQEYYEQEYSDNDDEQKGRTGSGN